MQMISFEQSRRVDRIAIQQWGMSGLVLMENAGRGVATRLAQLSPDQRFLILCGKGNNGGDGFVIARHLQLLGGDVSLMLTSEIESLSDDARVNARIADLAGIPMQQIGVASESDLQDAFSQARVIVDCLLGTGVSGRVREPARSLIERANTCRAHRIAVDVPSGWPVGDDAFAFEAERTFTFVARKHGMETDNADRWIGVVEVIGIGVPAKLIEQALADS